VKNTHLLFFFLNTMVFESSWSQQILIVILSNIDLLVWVFDHHLPPWTSCMWKIFVRGEKNQCIPSFSRFKESADTDDYRNIWRSVTRI